MNEKRVTVFLNKEIKNEIETMVFGDNFVETFGTLVEELTGEKVESWNDQISLDEAKRCICFRLKTFSCCIDLEAQVLSEP